MNRPSTDYRLVIEFWFGELPMRPVGLADRHKLWYRVDAATDTLIRDRFGAMVEAAVAGSYRSWEKQALSRLALIVVLDQFTRNIHRGRAGAFDGDARALCLALDAIDRGMDREVDLHSVFNDKRKLALHTRRFHRLTIDDPWLVLELVGCFYRRSVKDAAA